jgi:NifU-like protein involved in Fe-S cluster formation
MAAGMNAPVYTIEILRLAASSAEPADLPRADGSAEVRSPTCGSIVRTAVAVGEDGRVEALSQHVNACAFGQASAALVANQAAGKDRDQVERALAGMSAWLEGGDTLPDWPGVAALAPARARKGRHGAILLPFRALLAAMKDAG